MSRLFVAIDIPERVRDEIMDTYAAIPGAKWIPEEQIHITLRFIGEVDGAMAQDITAALKRVTVPPFSLTVKGVGFFPPRKEPRVLWVGIEENEELVRLQGKIERTITGLGLKPEDKKFHAHITVARLNNSPQERVASYITDNSLFHCDPFTVSEFQLYQSILRREGAHYIKEASYLLSE